MPHRHPACEQAQLGIGLARVFGDKAEQAVAAQKHHRHLPFGAFFLGKQPHDGKQRDAFQRKLVKLRGMARQAAVLQQPFGVLRVLRGKGAVGFGGLRKAHRPEVAGAGYAPPQLAVDKVANAPRCQACRHQRGDKIHHLPKAQAAPLGKQPHGKEHAQKAAVKRHAAFPHFEHIERMGKVFAEVVEQNVADAPAQNHAEHAVGEQVVQHFFGEHGVALFDAPPPQPDK